MEQLFSELTRALQGAAWLALLAAAAWGVLSIVLSPCHLASIPLVVGVISGQQQRSAARSIVIASVFSVGILLTIALIGFATAFAGRVLGDLGGWINYVVALLFVLVGLYLMGVIRFSWSCALPTMPQGRSVFVSALVLGLVFGLAVGPCTFAYMAPMLGVAFKVAGTSLLFSAALLLAYGIGHCGVIVIAGASAGLVQKYLNLTESIWAPRLRVASGVLIALAGLLVLWQA